MCARELGVGCFLPSLGHLPCVIGSLTGSSDSDPTGCSHPRDFSLIDSSPSPCVSLREDQPTVHVAERI